MPNLPAFILEQRFTTEEIIKKWDDIGLTDEQKPLVAGYFENEMRDQVEEYDAHGLDGQAVSVANFCLGYDNYNTKLKLNKLKKLKQLSL